MDAWGTPEFMAELRAWIESEVGPVTGLAEGKRRPWAALWRAETSGGDYYAKQNCPGQAFEARLMGILAQLEPTYVVPVTAVHADRGFLLTPDQGQVFGETVAPDDLTLINVYSEPGETVILVAWHARADGQTPTIADGESTAVQLFPPDALPDLAFPRNARVLTDARRVTER